MVIVIVPRDIIAMRHTDVIILFFSCPHKFFYIEIQYFPFDIYKEKEIEIEVLSIQGFHEVFKDLIARLLVIQGKNEKKQTKKK